MKRRKKEIIIYLLNNEHATAFTTIAIDGVCCISSIENIQRERLCYVACKMHYRTFQTIFKI